MPAVWAIRVASWKRRGLVGHYGQKEEAGEVPCSAISLLQRELS